MSRNIKGITIEIDGDSRKLEDGLKSVNKSSREIQNELKQVERLLKLDPGNTELVAQKQKLLGDAVGVTTQKLDALKDAERQVAEQFKRGEVGEEQYRAIQREVIKTEQELRGLKSQVTEVNRTWEDAAKKLDNIGKKSTDIGKKMLPVSAAIGAAGIGVTKMAVDFEDAIAKVSTIADASVPIDELKSSIIELSNETGIAAGDIAENVYNAISAGQDTGDAVAFVREATMLAKAGFTESASALDIMTTALNAYGLEADQAARVSDVLIMTQNLGKTTVDELSSSMGKVIPAAKAAGIEIEQLGAAYSILTSNGIRTAESTTYLNSMIGELSKSGTKASNVIRNETGKSFQELIAEGKTLADIMEIIQGAAEETGVSMLDMFGSAEAARAANILAGNADEFTQNLDQMNNSAGATAEAFEKMQTPGEKMRITLNKLKNEAMKFGDILVPIFEKLVDLVTRLADWFGKLTDEQRNLIIVVAAVVMAIAPLLITFGKLATGISALIKLFGVGSAATGLAGAAGAAGGTLGLLAAPAGPILALAAAIGIVSAAVRWLIDDFNKLDEKGKEVARESRKGSYTVGAGDIARDYRESQKASPGGKPASTMTNQMIMDMDRALINQMQIESNRLPKTDEVHITGSIRHEGINDKGDLVAAVDVVMDELRRELRLA